MIYVFKQPDTPADAMIELDKLADEAATVMMPDNFKRLGQRRNKLNAHYDQVQIKANLHANTEGGDPKWLAVSERITRDKEILTAVKTEMQTTGIQLY